MLTLQLYLDVAVMDNLGVIMVKVLCAVAE